MDSIVGNIEQLIQEMSMTGYIYAGLSIVIAFFLIHAYSSGREKKKLKRTLESYVNIFQKAFDLCEDVTLILSDTFVIIYANKTAMKTLGLDVNCKGSVLSPMPMVKRKREWQALSDCIEGKGEAKTSKVHTYPRSSLRTHNDQEIPINLFIDSVRMTGVSQETYSVVSMHDLSASNECESMAFKHRLTLLPNQLQAIQDFPMLYSRVHTKNSKIALVLMDFDNFTRLRSVIGYEQSNALIIKFSKYLNTIVSKMNVKVYHTFDNHFLLSVWNLRSMGQIENLVRDIQIRLATFYKIEDVSLHLTVSAGIAVYPDSGSTRQLLDNTYKALTQAKGGGDGRVYTYLPNKNKNVFDELTLNNDMKGGLDRSEFEVYYQPIVRADTHEIVSAEALIRWIHPTLGFIPPDHFISLMEKTGFIVKLGQYILEDVLKQQKRWELFKFKQIPVSINVSMVEIATGDFVQNVKKQLEYHKVDPALIKFEITEGIAMLGEGKSEKYFTDLKHLGVSILLDDFGTGYTSFNYLKKFPADIIKIDKSLVDYILDNVEDQRIVKAMIDLGHNLGMKIVVEGVENKEMVAMLNSFGCDFIQGYYFSKPLPMHEFQNLLR